MPDARCQMPDARCRIPHAGCGTQVAGYPDEGYYVKSPSI